MSLQVATAFVLGAVIFGGIGILMGQWIAWWFLFPLYRRQWRRP